MEDTIFLIVILLLLIYKFTGDWVQRRNKEVREEHEFHPYNQFYIHVTDYMFDRKYGAPEFTKYEDDGITVIDQGYQWSNITKDDLDYLVYAAKQYEVVHDTEAVGSLASVTGVSYSFASFTLKQRRQEWEWKYWL